jgi:YHS domain-containing protein
MIRISVTKAMATVLVLLMVMSSGLIAEEPTTYAEYNNKVCPVMGHPVDSNVSIVYQGKKIYFCCPGCDKKFLKNPEKYLSILEQEKEDSEEDEW